MVWIILISFIIALDQLVKIIIINNISLTDSIVVVKGFFYVSHFENKGIAWSLLESKLFLFIPLTVIITLLLGAYLYKSNNRLERTAVSFILGGAVGNLLDRVTKGSVTDFLEFHFGSYVFPIFNIADIFVVIGALILSYCIYKKEVL
ncbi:MAG: hypothetical protein JM58_11930 [Peptococcaceae bacterium BICA1-8]|nr:MAG: hypothetical protein JM58_11930 [Peptococcaceae bacterium BICA1-8]